MTPHTTLVTLMIAGALAAPVRLTAQRPDDTATLLANARAYLADYEKPFAAIVSEEHYTQETHGVSTTPMRVGGSTGAVTSHRTLVSDVLVVNLGERSWVAFRDVFKVDGEPVRDRSDRLQKLFTDTPDQALAQAKKIMDESSRYNLGSIRRNVNVPTMALTYLRGANQERSVYRVTGTEKVGGVKTVILSFVEVATPTIIRSQDRNLPATGRFWIDPNTGRVCKSELSVKDGSTRTHITVTYAPVPKLTVWAPSVMTEEYGTGTGESISCEARYTNFRQFAVSSKIVIKPPAGA